MGLETKTLYFSRDILAILYNPKLFNCLKKADRSSNLLLLKKEFLVNLEIYLPSDILLQENNIFLPAAYISLVQNTEQPPNNRMVVRCLTYPIVHRISSACYDVEPVRKHRIYSRTILEIVMLHKKKRKCFNIATKNEQKMFTILIVANLLVKFGQHFRTFHWARF